MPTYDIDLRNSQRARKRLAVALKRFDGALLDECETSCTYMVCACFESADATEEALRGLVPQISRIALSSTRRAVGLVMQDEGQP